MTVIVPRDARRLLHSAFERYGCVLLLGPRQVGKTTLARTFANEYCESQSFSQHYFDLGKEKDRGQLQNIDKIIRPRNNKLVVLDEAQNMHKFFSRLRGFLDTVQKSHHNIVRWSIVGSREELEAVANTNLIGRYVKVILTPFHFLELSSHNQSMATPSFGRDALFTDQDPIVRLTGESEKLQEEIWLRGGFPRSIRARDMKESFQWRRQYVENFLGPQDPNRSRFEQSDLLLPLWERLAVEQGKCNVEKLRGRLGCNKDKLDKLFRFLELEGLIRKVRLWDKHLRKRQDKQPYWFIRDSGLLHSQLSIHSIDGLVQSGMIGKSWGRIRAGINYVSRTY